MTWGFIWLMLALKLPLAGLIYIVWWAVKQEPETAPRQKCHTLWHYLRVRPRLRPEPRERVLVGERVERQQLDPRRLLGAELPQRDQRRPGRGLAVQADDAQSGS